MNKIEKDYQLVWNYIKNNSENLEKRLIDRNWMGSQRASAAAQIPLLLAKSLPSLEHAKKHDIRIIFGELVRGNLEIFSRDEINGIEIIKIASEYYYGDYEGQSFQDCIKAEETSPKQFYYYTLDKTSRVMKSEL